MKDFDDFFKLVNSPEKRQGRLELQKRAINEYTKDGKLNRNDIVRACTAASEDTALYLIELYHQWATDNA